MEDYGSLVQSVLSPNYKTAYRQVNVDDNNAIIVLDNDILLTCPQLSELKDNMNKRLPADKQNPGRPNLSLVATLCLATNDYSISHKSILNMSERDMLKVWGYLERQAVSCTWQLRRWIKERIGTRTCEGYMAKWSVSRTLGTRASNNVVVLGSWKKVLNVTDEMAYKVRGQPATVKEAAFFDMCTCGSLQSLNL